MRSSLRRLGSPDQLALRAAVTSTSSAGGSPGPTQSRQSGSSRSTSRSSAPRSRPSKMATSSSAAGSSILRLPTERCSRIAHRGDGVPTIVLAIAECAHPVLPCFAPVDRRDTDQYTTDNDRRWRGPPRALLEDVIAAQVVIDATLQARKVGGDEIALGRMQVPARRIAAQRPRRSSIGLPRRDRERELEEDRNRVAAERHGQGQPTCAHIIETCRQAIGRKLKLDARRPRIGPERVGLVRPVEIPGTWRIAAQVVFTALVVFENDAGCIHASRSLSTTQRATYVRCVSDVKLPYNRKRHLRPCASNP